MRRLLCIVRGQLCERAHSIGPWGWHIAVRCEPVPGPRGLWPEAAYMRVERRQGDEPAGQQPRGHHREAVERRRARRARLRRATQAVSRRRPSVSKRAPPPERPCEFGRPHLGGLKLAAEDLAQRVGRRMVQLQQAHPERVRVWVPLAHVQDLVQHAVRVQIKEPCRQRARKGRATVPRPISGCARPVLPRSPPPTDEGLDNAHERLGEGGTPAAAQGHVQLNGQLAVALRLFPQQVELLLLVAGGGPRAATHLHATRGQGPAGSRGSAGGGAYKRAVLSLITRLL